MGRKILHQEQRAVVGSVLKEARLKAGFTQAQLSMLLGRHQSYVSKYERAEVRLDIIDLKAICEVLGVSFQGFARLLDRRIR